MPVGYTPRPGFSFPGPPPKEAIQFFKSKGLAVGFDYRDVWRQEHAVAFTVAKAMQVDVLESLQGSLAKALEGGIPYRQWAKDLTPELQKLGWWGRKEMTDPTTGEVIDAQLGSPRRLKTIYRANMRTARAAGQWERAQRTKRLRPYFIYELGASLHHRPEHVSWAGTIVDVDDPWLNDHAPPNDYGCNCRLRQLGKREAERLGGPKPPPPTRMVQWENKRTGRTERVPAGIGPGWNTNPGKDRLRAFTAPNEGGGLPTSFPSGTELPPLPAPRSMSPGRLQPDGLTDDAYIDGFLREFGATRDRPTVYVDKIGQPVVIGADLFRNADGSLKVRKGGRHMRLAMVAEAIRDPDEIWWVWEPIRNFPGRHTLRRRYVAQLQVKGEQSPALAVFEWGKDGWNGVTGFPVDAGTSRKQKSYLRGVRVGLLAYRRAGRR
jgi:hypothetical protein